MTDSLESTRKPPTVSLEAGVFRSLFSAYPDALIVTDASGVVVLANPGACELLGYAPDELVGLNVDALVPEAVRPNHASYREAYGHSPRPRPMGTQMELTARRKDGAQVMVEISLSPLQDHGLPYVVAAIRGIGAYPRVRQALQRARYSDYLARLGSIAVDARDPQIVVDHTPALALEALEIDAAMVFLLEPNRAELRVAAGVGIVGDEYVGARIPYDPDSSPGLVLSSGQPLIVEDYRAERRFVVPPAYLAAGFVSALSVPVQDRGRTIGALTVRSHHARSFGEDEIRFMVALASLLATSLQRAQSEEALNHSQRLESVGQLTGGIAHDFNNLLTVIQGNLQVLEELPALVGDAYAQQLVSAAARASRRGAELTGKLLAFSRRQVLLPSAVDVPALLQSLSGMLRRTLDQRVVIEVEAPIDCPPVQVDAGQLEAALLNIAINARDAMPEGGTLRFEARTCAKLPSEVMSETMGEVDRTEGYVLPETGYVSISISDTGAGMTDAVRERAFEPFFTTKAAGRGTGLGLSTVYGFVKQSNGAIVIASRLLHGTSVTLFLPRSQEVERETETESADAAGQAQTIPEGLHVLLVEDDAEVRDVARAFLQHLGCDVTSAPNAEQALQILDAEKFELLLTDIALGHGMRGTDLAARAQSLDPRLAILLMSGFSADLLDADRESPASWELLHKPYTRSELAQAIARVLAN
jgi:PAS domain S-box-containing protein